MSEKMLPCPFCGESPIRIGHDATGRAHGVCHNCKACGPKEYTRYDAITAWNRRAGGWQPIETAPKDGSFVLLFSSDGDIYFGRWLVDEWDIGYDAIPEFSHWRPLPAPPEVLK